MIDPPEGFIFIHKALGKGEASPDEAWIEPVVIFGDASPLLEFVELTSDVKGI